MGLTIALLGWEGCTGDAQPQQQHASLVQTITAHGGVVLHGAGVLEAVMEARADFCVCRSYGAPQFSASRGRPPPRVALRSPLWVLACAKEGTRLPTTVYPHFEPGRGPLPLAEMGSCIVRITAVENTNEGRLRRARLHELVEVLGARVASQQTKASQITHIVCDQPSMLEDKTVELSTRRKIPIVKAVWLFDCFAANAKAPEEKYLVASADRAAAPKVEACQPAEAQPQRSFTSAVLESHHVLISPSALGSDGQLPQMAQELGATVQIWRSREELENALRPFGILPAPQGEQLKDAEKRRSVLVALLEKEEASSGPLEPLMQLMQQEEQQGVFVQPAWLRETYSQRRLLPLDAFAALPRSADADAPAKKKPRLEEEDAAYAWQSEASTKLQELSKDSREREMQTKAQERLTEGLRRADTLRRAGSCEGAPPGPALAPLGG